MAHPALSEGKVAVVTGAASGIGLAAVKRFASLGMRVCMTDIAADDLEATSEAVAGLTANGADDVLAIVADVGDASEVAALADAVFDTFGRVDLLMNNAVTRVGGGAREPLVQWHRAVDVNLWGVIHGVHTFLPRMLEQDAPSIVVNTGSKQGITNPPGNSAYNMTKAAVKSYTESLQHELRNLDGCRVTAHLLVPGWTTTGKRPHVQGAWLPEQVVDVLVPALERGDFYIICPDDEVTPEMDRQRILWAAGDIVDNRPPLSRWHPDYQRAFETFSAGS